MPSKIRFLLDENVARSTVDFLRRTGYDTATVSELRLKGRTDDIVLKHATRDKRVILTLDKDFGALLQKPLEGNGRVVLMRLKDMRPSAVNQRLKAVLPFLAEALRQNRLVVVSETRIRLRR